MDQIRMLEALVASVKQSDDQKLTDFLVALRAAEKTLRDVFRERIDWREYRALWPDRA